MGRVVRRRRTGHVRNFAATHATMHGTWEGWDLRVRGGVAEASHKGGRWLPAPLRRLARDYAADHGPWPWLRSHGITRPNPSGRTIPTSQRHRKQIMLTLSDEARARLEALAEGSGESRSAVVERLVLGAR